MNESSKQLLAMQNIPLGNNKEETKARHFCERKEGKTWEFSFGIIKTTAGI